jgi:hypothetical protein
MEKTFEKAIADARITMAVKHGAPVNETFKDSDPWTCTLKRGRKRMTVPFYMGIGHNGKEPTAAEVLSCLLSDASSADDARSFEDFAGELGYDVNSRKAERIYKACQRTSRKLHAFLGDTFDTLLEASRDY